MRTATTCPPSRRFSSPRPRLATGLTRSSMKARESSPASAGPPSKPSPLAPGTIHSGLPLAPWTAAFFRGQHLPETTRREAHRSPTTAPASALATSPDQRHRCLKIDWSIIYSHRHSLNTLLRAARVPDPLVQRVTEHRTQEMTEHHRHFTLEDLTRRPSKTRTWSPARSLPTRSAPSR
jgi:hypothetical protein